MVGPWPGSTHPCHKRTGVAGGGGLGRLGCLVVAEEDLNGFCGVCVWGLVCGCAGGVDEVGCFLCPGLESRLES